MKYLALGKRLKQIRERKALSLEELADRSGIDMERLKKIELDEEQPIIAHLIKLSKALEVNVADLFRDRPQGKNFQIIRASGRERVRPLREVPRTPRIFDYQYELLTGPDEGKNLNAYLIEIPPYQKKPPRENMTHPGEEFMYLLEGRLEGEISGESFILEAGDSLYLKSTQPHVFYNSGKVMARAITVIYPF